MKKKRSVFVIILLIAVAAIAIGVALAQGRNGDETPKEDATVENPETVDEENSPTPMPEFELFDSSIAIEATYSAAQSWASDAQLFDCSGLVTSVYYDDISYENIGHSAGKYSSWICNYYSDSLKETMIYVYEDGEVDDETEPLTLERYQELLYQGVDYQTPSSIISSEIVYRTVIENGADEETNILNMYLRDTADFGFAWIVEEKSKTEFDEYDIEKLVNSYVVNPITGDLITIAQEDII